MCLAIPGRIRSVEDDGSLFRRGRVDFGGIVKEINLAFVPEASTGDYVIVHAGVAISRLDEKQATEVFDYLAKMGELSELREGS
jgi:hydrogenase expression/formation protein HypC